MKFFDILELAIELEHRGLDSRSNSLQALRYFSDNCAAEKITGFEPFKLKNKDGSEFSANIKVTPVFFCGIGGYNDYIWEVN